MNITFFLAFSAGFLSFLSPCVFPLIPGYLSYITGQQLETIDREQKKIIFLKTISFTFGFSLIFISFGITASFIGQFFSNNSFTLKILAGIIIILFSLQLMNIINFNFLNKELRFFTNKYSNNLFFPILVGAAFGFGWTPCIGPILGSILALAASESSLYKSIILLTFYSIGLAVPFIISGVLIHRFLLVSKRIKKYLKIISKICGLILLATGISIITGHLQIFGFMLIRYFPFFGQIG